ncbi:MAG TPA: double-strand break repair helicase AddA [Asticcacaulis sp.]|nr:double-strand break repair helicase AddA [Asticcacaulis sp.]
MNAQENVKTNNQNIAADPKASCFLTANAGSGKTSTLVNRVARLLLDGAKPEHILCVTYTKAAAAEMQARLFETLGSWAVAEDAELEGKLRAIEASTSDLAAARALFAKALETPGGLKIQTIHAFCEKLLRRFPLEAKLSPAFQVLDDFKARDIADAAQSGVLTLESDALANVRMARDRLILRLRINGFERLLGQFIARHDAIAETFENLQKRGDWEAALFHSLGLDGICTSHECLAAYANRLEWQAIKELAGALSAGTSKTNQQAGQAFFDLHVRFHAGQGLDIDILKTIFFTKEGGPRKNLYTKETRAADAMVMDEMAGEVAALIDQLKAVDIASDTLDALRLFAIFSAVYQDRKAREGALDFQDLINKTKALLSDEFMSLWVLFKLDGGLEHILVDEAQDTSEDQWAIVKALSGEFFSGHGQSSRVSRTVFAVGDEKQSIYGFQGADPAKFLDAGQYFQPRVEEAGQKFVAPDLIESWRSLPEILGFVDAAFDNADLAAALNLTGNVITHKARRSDGAGCVELWPLAQSIDVPEPDADDDEAVALDEPGHAHPAKRLAQQIAASVRADIDAGRGVFDKGTRQYRAMHAGDVLILVRKRDLLFEHIIRELKISGVAVSGADRLKLGEHIAFQDLRTLLRFCLQPRDDLSLACVLRSPLCDLSEQDLYILAQGRTSSLWRALLDNRDETGAFAEARVFLLWAQRAAAQLTAFDFLSRVLNRRDAGGRSLKQRFLTRLGDECEDVLDETLGLALKAEGAGRISLSACLDLFEFNASEIKREQEEGGHSVRVMTVHGSKGLEAPWVILPIGPQHRSASKADLLMTSADGDLYLCAGGRVAETQVITDIRLAKTQKDEEEGLRLFYVAVTRARDRLTVCGYAGKKAAPRGLYPAWYDLAADAMANLEVTEEVIDLTAPFDDFEMSKQAVIRVFGRRSAIVAAEARPRPQAVVLPPFITAPVPQADIESERWRAISQLGDEDRDAEEPGTSPLDQRGGLGRYRRGNLIHKLFEILPEVPPPNRADMAARYLARQSDLSDDQRREMTGAVMAVLTDARFADAFGPESRPEVALAGQIGTAAGGEAIMLSGRIDRLVVTKDRVLIIDYKSNRPAPDRAEDASLTYQRQMAGYVALLRQIYPDRAIDAALLWTDGPKLTPLSETLVNLRLAELLAR